VEAATSRSRWDVVCYAWRNQTKKKEKITDNQLIVNKNLKKMKHITKILGFGILFLILTSFQLSAQKCKYDYNKTDPITGEISKRISKLLEQKTIVGTVGNICRSEIGFNKLGDSYFISMKIDYSGSVREYIQKDDPFIFKLSNGETVTLKAADDYRSVVSTIQAGTFSRFIAKYYIDEVSLQKIAEFAPTFFRLSIENRTYDREIPTGEQKKISQAAACILQ
jgi:hypothetical protein